MAKKRKTLPADFKEIAERGNLDELKSVFDKCDINAYGGYNKGNAFYFDGIGEDFIRWAVAEGMDVNFEDTWGNPPISGQFRNLNNIKVLLELGADIDKRNRSNCTTFCYLLTIPMGTLEKTRFFVEHGADINSLNGKYGENITPLQKALQQCNNADISRIAKVVPYLIEKGAKITPDMKESVRKIGESFEFYRDGFNKEFLPETEQGLQRLYELFDVEPIAHRVKYDGKSPIKVKSKTWDKQFEELWELLIPGSGHASTVQGEVIRIAGKIRREIYHNGACNWNRDFKKLPQAMPAYFAMGNTFKEKDLEKAVALAKSISANSDDDDLNMLCKYAVEWVLLNPNPISLEKVDYDR